MNRTAIAAGAALALALSGSTVLAQDAASSGGSQDDSNSNAAAAPAGNGEPASAPADAAAGGGQDAENVLELRNTVVNLLQALVQRGVLTQAEAQTMVADAQQRARKEAEQTRAAEAAQRRADEGAVRVTYVPKIVQDKIETQVREDVEKSAVQGVLAKAKDEGWGIPGALPHWVNNLDFATNLRVRGEGRFYGGENATNTYLDYDAVNRAGGIAKAGQDALLNTSEDRGLLRARLRVDVTAHLTPRLDTLLTFTTGNLNDPVSMNETLGNDWRRLNFAVQNAAMEWKLENERATRGLNLYLGQFPNPFLSTQMVWDEDLSFQGFASKVGFDVFKRKAGGYAPGVWLTLGAFPLQEVALAADKWLYAGQVGLEAPIGGNNRFRFGAAYYDFKNVTGIKNAMDSRLTDWSAPLIVGRGNTVFDIRNDADPNTNLIALASEFRLADLMAQLDFGAFGPNRVKVTFDYVDNRGFDAQEVQMRTGRAVEPRTKGRDVELSIGRDRVADNGEWRVFAAYRRLERDAVLAAFTDSDFGLGGTDTEGFILGFDLGLSRNTWLRTKWLSSNEIDYPPLGIDVPAARYQRALLSARSRPWFTRRSFVPRLWGSRGCYSSSTPPRKSPETAEIPDGSRP